MASLSLPRAVLLCSAESQDPSNETYKKAIEMCDKVRRAHLHA